MGCACPAFCSSARFSRGGAETIIQHRDHRSINTFKVSSCSEGGEQEETANQSLGFSSRASLDLLSIHMHKG
jgi:hypothetical protein